MQSFKKIKKVSVRFPERLKREMHTSLINSGHGLHGKSKWLKGVIKSFVSKPNFIDYVQNGIPINQADLSQTEAFYLDAETIEILKKAFIHIRAIDPLFEGVQSALIRSAIVYHLMLQ